MSISTDNTPTQAEVQAWLSHKYPDPREWTQRLARAYQENMDLVAKLAKRHSDGCDILTTYGVCDCGQVEAADAIRKWRGK